MGTLIKQEWYKLAHKNGTWIAIGVMVAIQVFVAVMGRLYPDVALLKPEVTTIVDYYGGGLVIFIAIANVASTVSMEFQYGTMKQLLYRQYYRSQVFMSKVIVAICHFVLLQAIASVVTFALAAGLNGYDWMAVHQGRSNLAAYGLSLAGFMLMGLMLLSCALMLSTVLKTNAAAIISGFVGYFVVEIASSILTALIAKWEFLKWNPFTFLLVGQQLTSDSVRSLTHLSDPVMIAGSLIYTLVFGLIAYASFRKRSI
ncbi:ABC transporter permease [Lacticaseibacillus absianus]|uniref:ABC transporter permease n=1 Tax=Lacticaseibacillus absianus TaxID=2729623 RepID=UPI0015CEC097|nr:ABC transporter permease subunit [Lacticaseibacillus absianus]